MKKLIMIAALLIFSTASTFALAPVGVSIFLVDSNGDYVPGLTGQSLNVKLFDGEPGTGTQIYNEDISDVDIDGSSVASFIVGFDSETWEGIDISTSLYLQVTYDGLVQAATRLDRVIMSQGAFGAFIRLANISLDEDHLLVGDEDNRGSALAPGDNNQLLGITEGTPTWKNLPNLTDGHGIEDFTYNGLSTATVVLDETSENDWTGQQTVTTSASGTLGTLELENEADNDNSYALFIKDGHTKFSADTEVQEFGDLEGTYQIELNGQSVVSISYTGEDFEVYANLPDPPAGSDGQIIFVLHDENSSASSLNIGSIFSSVTIESGNGIAFISFDGDWYPLSSGGFQ